MEAELGEQWFWKSWIDSANAGGAEFPMQNLPFCAFRVPGGETHLGVGIGDAILDLHDCMKSGLCNDLEETIRSACAVSQLNSLMGLGRASTSLLRGRLMLLLREDAVSSRRSLIESMLRPRAGASFQLPVQVGDYSDFYASIHHATAVGRLFRPDEPLLPNYKFIPIGYHGRASSLVVSGTPVIRPHGQQRSASSDRPVFGPTQQLDYELEVATYVGEGNALGEPIDVHDAEQYLFGVSLLNDWSARDIQAWEYAPLGPFLGKSFMTSVSPWVVSMEALAPFRVPLAKRPPADPAPLPYLCLPETSLCALDMTIEAFLSTQAMRDRSEPPMLLSSANLRELYWSFAQMVTHHTSNGCNLRPGDLIASGTISGPGDHAAGSLLEITRRATTPIHLPGSQMRSFLEDGDEVILRGFCERPGVPRIGLGECRGIVTSPVS